jgi:hypothetical protein
MVDQAAEAAGLAQNGNANNITLISHMRSKICKMKVDGMKWQRQFLCSQGNGFLFPDGA